MCVCVCVCVCVHVCACVCVCACVSECVCVSDSVWATQAIADWQDELAGRLTCERMKMRGETGEESRYTRESSAVWGSMKRCPRWEETKSWCVCVCVQYGYS